jgi:gag-polypeptide of LTR copia-type/Zinc knuckle
MMAYMTFVGLKGVLDATPVSSTTTTKTSASATVSSNVTVKTNVDDVDDQERAYTILMMCLDDARIELVMHVPVGDAAGVWTELVKHYERKTMASKAHTRSMLHKTKMSENEQFDTYRSRITQLVMKLRSMRADVGDDELMYVILEGLPKSYSQLKQSLEVQNDITVEEICNHIRDHQEKVSHRRENEESNSEVAYMVRVKGRGSNIDESAHRCRLCKKIGHMEWNCSLRKGGDGDCFKCGRAGHYVKDCDKTNREEANFIQVEHCY